MTLPEEVQKSLEERAPILPSYHNWLYSVVPANLPFRTDRLDMFLAGYCKFCNRVFSVQIPISDNGEYLEVLVDIPKEGCVPK